MVITGIIAEPDLKQIAEDIEVPGFGAALLQKSQEKPGDSRVFLAEM